MSDIPPELALPESQAAPPAQGPTTSQPEPPSSEPRSPLLAALLSIVPGAGHFYVGQRVRGIAYFFLVLALVGLTWWTSVTSEFEVFPGLVQILIGLTALIWLWVIGSATFAADRRRFLPRLGLVLVLAYTYLLGWQVTEVRLDKFFTEFGDIFKILSAVMWPWDDAAFTRPIEYDITQTRWATPCPSAETPLTEEQAHEMEQVEGDGSQPWVVVEPTCGEFAQDVREGNTVRQVPGTSLTVRGGGMRPNQEVQIWWRSPGGSEPFRPQTPTGRPTAVADEQGNFEVSFTAPAFNTPTSAVGIQLHNVQARQIASVGEPQPTENLKRALDRIIITIFQALMGTTFGIVMALPLSFFAARNLVLMEGSPVRWGGIFTLIFVPLEGALLIRLGAPGPINSLLALSGTLGVLVLAGVLMYGIVKALAAVLSQAAVNRILDATGMLFYYILRGILNVTRSIEPIIWAVIAAAWVGLGPFAGVIALTLHTVASLAKLYSEAIESIDSGPLEAIQATGATWTQMVMFGVIPQLIPPFLSFTIYRWDINVRMSTIIGYVGGGGIGQLLFQWILKTDWDAVGLGVWLIAATVSFMDYASSELRKRFV